MAIKSRDGCLLLTFSTRLFAAPWTTWSLDLALSSIKTPQPYELQKACKSCAAISECLSGPNATIILSRDTVAPHSVALRFSRIWRGVAGDSRYTPLKDPCSTYLFSSSSGCRTSSCLLEDVAAQEGVAATLSLVELR